MRGCVLQTVSGQQCPPPRGQASCHWVPGSSQKQEGPGRKLLIQGWGPHSGPRLAGTGHGAGLGAFPFSSPECGTRELHLGSQSAWMGCQMGEPQAGPRSTLFCAQVSELPVSEHPPQTEEWVPGSPCRPGVQSHLSTPGFTEEAPLCAQRAGGRGLRWARPLRGGHAMLPASPSFSTASPSHSRARPVSLTSLVRLPRCAGRVQPGGALVLLATTAAPPTQGAAHQGPLVPGGPLPFAVLHSAALDFGGLSLWPGLVVIL